MPTATRSLELRLTARGPGDVIAGVIRIPGQAERTFCGWLELITAIECVDGDGAAANTRGEGTCEQASGSLRPSS